MALVRVRAIACFLAVTAVTTYGFQRSPSNRPWPPDVQPVSSASPPLRPELALKTFHMPPGYHLELVANEPLIQDPVAIDWDLAGRLWAVEMPGFMPDVSATNERDPVGRVVVLEDTNADGMMDKRTVFADGLVLARSIKVLDRGVLVAEPPNVWLMRDTNGDLRMDAKELLTDRFGHRDSDPETNANSFHWAIDNWMYAAGQSAIQLRFKNGAFEVLKTLERGEWGVAEDDAGRIYRNTNESALHVDHVPTFYFARNAHLLRTRGSYERLGDEANQLNTVWPVRPNPGTNRAYQAGIDRPDGSLAKFTSVCTPVVYNGDRLPAELYGSVFVAEPAANVVSRIILEDGPPLRARKAYGRGEFIASTDERFRPVYLSNAPDGTLYVVDMYRGIIEHKLSLTVYLRDYIVKQRLEEPTRFGRIYRVVHDTTRRDTRIDLSGATPSQLVDMLSAPGGWRRETAQRLLIERADRLLTRDATTLSADGRTIVGKLSALAGSAKDWRVRLRALWTLDGLDVIEAPLVERALRDPSREVRVSAVRLAERWMSTPDHRLRAAVLRLIDDADVSVRRQLGASLGAMEVSERATNVVSLLERHADDPITLDAAMSSLDHIEADVLEVMLRASDPSAQREAAITMLAATIVRSGDDTAIQRMFGWMARGTRPDWQQASLLRGAEVALLGAPMPGASAARGSAPPSTAPCLTCPGGRAGPGGAYAYSTPDDFVRARVRPEVTARRALRLNTEPLALSALARDGGALGARAASVLERLAWPGKAGVVEVTPLTADEQRRFDAGRELYRNVCQACHQPDGRGQEKIAPSLIGSTLLLATADVPARILLNGKEGPIGLMPPIGATISDEEIASVLTYVRREWGQTGAPVDPAAVAAIRMSTAGRTRPWTNDELLALTKESR
jgi:mono/diheme cytochrome c family protein/glucose/arabinose dehydrogenase